MAKLTTLESPEKTGIPPGRNGRGKAADAVEEPVIQQDKRLPKIGNPAAGSNQEFLESITDKEWQNLTCYVYRTAPAIDRQAAGKEISIDKVGAKFDMKDILNRHGSGRYKFVLCFAPPSGGHWIRVRQWYETVFDMEKPPRVPLGDWLDNPANKDWEWCRPLLRAEEVIREQQAAEKIGGGKNNQGNPIEQLSETIDLAQKIMPKDNNTALLIELLKQNGAQNDPSKLLTLARELAALNKPAESGEGSMQAMFMKFMLDEIKAARETRNQAPADPLTAATAAITNVKGIMDSLGGFGGAGVPAKLDATSVAVQGATDILGKVVEGISSHLPSILQVWQYAKGVELQIATLAAQRNMNPERPYEYVGPTAPPVPAQQFQPSPPPAPAPPPQQPPPQSTEPQGPMTPQIFFTKYQAVLQRHFQILIDKFQNEDGYAFRDHIISREGLNTLNSIRADASIDLLMNLRSLHPQLKEIFQPEDKARLFFTEMLTDPDAPAGDPVSGEVEEEEPAQ